MSRRQRLVGTIAGTLVAIAGLVFAVLGILFAYAGAREPDVGSLLIALGGFNAVIGVVLIGGGFAIVSWARRGSS
jgi:hypothetical protein